jgi:hypothetical protein
VEVALRDEIDRRRATRAQQAQHAKETALFTATQRIGSRRNELGQYNCDTRQPTEKAMDLSIKFPNEADVVIEEVKRFRALSPEDRMRVIRGLLDAGALMLKVSPKATVMHEQTLEQENLARQNIKEFIARHAGSA